MAPALAKQRKIAIVGSRSVGELPCTAPFVLLCPQTRQLTLFCSLSLGKSSLAVRYVDGHFVESYYPTIENTFSKEIRYKGQDYATEIVDTAGQDEYSILNSKHFIGIHGYMLVYSVSSLQSFEMVQVIRDKILNHLVRQPPPSSPTLLSPSHPVLATNRPIYRARPASPSASSATSATCAPSSAR